MGEAYVFGLYAKIRFQSSVIPFPSIRMKLPVSFHHSGKSGAQETPFMWLPPSAKMVFPVT
jgi:hypothetical protein